MENEEITKEDTLKFMERYHIKTVGDIQEAIKDLFGKTMQNLLEAELETKLGYAKHDYANKDTDNSRNGYSPKTVQTEHGPVQLQIPRDRLGRFEPSLIKKHQRDCSSLEENVISMYACGMSTREIS